MREDVYGPRTCPQCGGAMDNLCDGTPYHEGQKWPFNDGEFCLRRQLIDAAKQLAVAKAEIEQLKHQLAYEKAKFAIEPWDMKPLKP